MAAHLERQRRTVRIPDIDPQAVLDVDYRHPAVVDIEAIEAAVVDGDPTALVIPHDQMSAGDQWMGDSQIGTQVTPDDYIVACREGALGSLVPHGQRGWG